MSFGIGADTIKKGWGLLTAKGLRPFLKAAMKKMAGSRNPDETQLVFKALTAQAGKGVMIDVGAHHGSSLRAFARSGWTVYAFEPDHGNRRILQSACGRLENVTILASAVSDLCRQQAAFYTSKESSGISALTAFHHSHRASESVPVTTLRTFIEQQLRNETTIDVLKIDTEGFDLNVLKGFPWERSRPRVVVCEFEDLKTIPLGYTFHDLAGYLEERGYRLIVSEWYPIEEYGVSHDWRCFRRYPCQLADERAWGNIIASCREDVYRALLHLCRLD
jgi:FkbM family methyltransferase